MTRLRRSFDTPLAAAALFSLMLLTLGGSVYAVEPSFEIQAKQAILIEVETGTVLYEKNADEPMSPSSMTKLMTGYLTFDALERGDLELNDLLPVSERSWRMGGSQMFLEVGERVPVEQLLQGVIVVSGNDACVALAEGIAGSEEYFAELMTEKAGELGMHNTQFLNSHGLHEDGHFSTARDLAILGQAIIQTFPRYYPYYSQESFSYSKDLRTGNPITQFNRNPVLGVVAGADGLKTGFTDEGGYGLVASAERGDRRIIMVINGLPSVRARAREAERLLNWGFRNFQTYDLLTAGQVVEDAPVWLGKTARVPLVTEGEVKETLSRVSRRRLTATVVYDSPIPAPVEKGDTLATLVLSGPEMEDINLPLVAGEDVEKVGPLGKIGSSLEFLLFGASGDDGSDENMDGAE